MGRCVSAPLKKVSRWLKGLSCRTRFFYAGGIYWHTRIHGLRWYFSVESRLKLPNKRANGLHTGRNYVIYENLQIPKGAAVAEWLSSWLAEQENRGSIPSLATWIFRDWLSAASKSRYGWKIAKSTLILKTTTNNQSDSEFPQQNGHNLMKKLGTKNESYIIGHNFDNLMHKIDIHVLACKYTVLHENVHENSTPVHHLQRYTRRFDSFFKFNRSESLRFSLNCHPYFKIQFKYEIQKENIKVCLWNTDYAPRGNKVQKSYF